LSNFKTHAITGLSSAIAITISCIYYGIIGGFSQLKIVATAIFFGSLFPDVDTKSTPTRLYAIGLIIATGYLFYIDLDFKLILIPLIPFLFAQAGIHRGWTHKIKTVLILFFTDFILKCITYIIKPEYRNVIDIISMYSLHIQAFAVGMLVHIFLDKISTFFKFR
jgi:hypothetical protein